MRDLYYLAEAALLVLAPFGVAVAGYALRERYAAGPGRLLGGMLIVCGAAALLLYAVVFLNYLGLL